VWVRPKAAHEWRLARAWVVASAEARDDAARVDVECLAEGRRTSRRVRAGELIVIVDRGTEPGRTDVMVCPDTDTFRRLANAQVQPGDAVVEIGASLGETTARLARTAHGAVAAGDKGPGSVVAIDITDTLFPRARARCDEVAPDAASIVRFLKLDALADKLGLLHVAEDADAVFLDIGGDRAGDTVALLLALLLDRSAPRLIVVKSEELARELRTAATPPAAGDQAPHLALLAHGLLEGTSEWFAWRCRAAEDRAAEDLARSAAPRDAHGSVSMTSSSSSSSISKSDDIGGCPDKARTRYRKNPLKQPRRTVAETGLEVCRFNNYHRCLKGDSCPFDHSHCHLCGQAGHTAHQCTEYVLSFARGAGASEASEAARAAR
jgi:predicted O-methyltransferase YrrM